MKFFVRFSAVVLGLLTVFYITTWLNDVMWLIFALPIGVFVGVLVHQAVKGFFLPR